MKNRLLTKQSDLEALCKELRQVEVIGFDTEFVSEHTYRPELCLIQLATDEHLVAVDPQAVDDLWPLWEVLAEGDQETVVHAAREELGFCLDATSKPLAGLFDVQIAAAMIGCDFPAGYGTLTQRILGLSMGKTETRTDWRKRPLTREQLNYALDDVRHLLPLREKIWDQLEQLNREDWLDDELTSWQEQVVQWRQGERYQSVSGSGNLHGRALAILRELWLWREQEARERNIPSRKVLRDDLLVEIAKRQVTEPRLLGAIRGMERSNVRQALPALVECVRRGLQQPPEAFPKPPRQTTPPQATMLGQFLSAALASVCREAQIAPSLVGNPTDVRDLISYRLSGSERSGVAPPRLATGWRADLVGELLADVLAGRVTIRIRNPRSEQPLSLEPYRAHSEAESSSPVSPQDFSEAQRSRQKSSRRRSKPSDN